MQTAERNRAARPALLLTALVTLATLIAGPGSARPAAAAGGLTLPPDFVDEVVLSGMNSPRAVAWLPDGRLLVAERGGLDPDGQFNNDINYASIRIADPDGSGRYTLGARAATLNVCGDGERGLLGLAVDPNFSSNGFIYTYYTHQAAGSGACAGSTQSGSGPKNRVSRWTLSGTIASNQQVLVDDMVSTVGIHNAGDLQFGADGTLFISQGDGGETPSRAGEVGVLAGKILRIKPDTSANGYSIPPDNPYANDSGARLCGTTPPQSGNGACQEVYAYGFRNPFRTAVEPGTSTLYAFDVGGGAWEEIDKVVSGGNHGWPTREGPCASGTCPPADFNNDPAYVNPISWYAHDDFNGSTDAAIIGGAFYRGTSYPAAYRGGLFFADYNRGWMRYLRYNSSSSSWESSAFASAGNLAGVIIGVRSGSGSDTDIYYLEDNDAASALHRIRYAPGGNLPPTVRSVSAAPTSGPVTQLFSFSADQPLDPDSSPGTLTFLWDFGDGQTAQTTTATTSHSYSQAGAKLVTLRLRDGGTPAATSEPVTVTVYPGNSPPSGAIYLENLTDLSRSDRYYAGDRWRFSAQNVTDAEDGTAGVQIGWVVTFQHRDHNHPFLSLSGGSGTAAIPDTGEHDDAVWYRFTLTLTDRSGLSTVIVQDLQPAKASLTLQTQPPGGTLLLDGQQLPSGSSVLRVVGFQSSLDLPASISLGQPYLFSSWVDGGPRQRIVRVPSGGRQLTALLVPERSRMFAPLVRR